MKDVLILKMWRHKLPASAALATMIAAFLWPALFLGGIVNWLRFFYYYWPQNLLISLTAVLSGVYVGLYVYDRKVASCCSIDSKVGGAAGSILGVVLGACPACIPFLSIFLPLSVTISLSYLSWVFSIFGICILLFFIWRMNGLKRFA